MGCKACDEGAGAGAGETAPVEVCLIVCAVGPGGQGGMTWAQGAMVHLIGAVSVTVSS